MNPVVSVCIQAYQHAAYIRQCLDSVLAQQTTHPFEIILGEDDSADGTREICINYANKYPGIIRLFLRAKKDKIYINGQMTGRFNFIENLKAARGKYIALLDGDDYWATTNKLQAQVDFMEANTDCSLSFHKTLHIQNNKVISPPDSFHEEKEQKFEIDILFPTGGKKTVHTSNCLFYRENISAIPAWFYEVPFLDTPIFFQNAIKGKIGFVPGIVSVYRIHNEGMWFSKKEPGNFMRVWHLFTIMADHYEGKVKDMLVNKRYEIGCALIKFYNNHLWEKRSWLRYELKKNRFPGDEALLQLLSKAPTARNYLFNSLSLTKKILRDIKHSF